MKPGRGQGGRLESRPTRSEPQASEGGPPPGLASRIAATQRRLSGIYRLELALRADHFLLSSEQARTQLPPTGPRTGLLALEEHGTLWLGLYFDPRDADDPAAILEETSHWLAVVWHAAQRRCVSPLLLELQAEVDRYAVARTAWAPDPLRHFARLRLRADLPRAQRDRYRTAHAAAFRYCRGLERRFPRRSDLPSLLHELRGFYRRAPESKLRAA
jgi:hypothetical protein